MKSDKKSALTAIVLFLLAILSSGHGQLLVKNSANFEIFRTNETGQVGIGTTNLGTNLLTVAGPEAVNGALTVSGATYLNTIKIAGAPPANTPGAGKILSSIDSQGNTVWSAPRTLAGVKVYYAGAAQPIGDPGDVGTAIVKVDFDQVQWDDGGDFNLTNNWFLVPRNGYYFISSTIGIRYTPPGAEKNTACTVILEKILAGTTTEMRLAQGNSQTPKDGVNYLFVGTVAYLNAGDKVYVKAAKNYDSGFDVFSPATYRKATIYLAIREL